MIWFPLVSFLFLISHFDNGLCDEFEEKEYGVKYADNCELCKIVSMEFQLALDKSGSKHHVIESGYNTLDKDKQKKTKYTKSEVRLIEGKI